MVIAVTSLETERSHFSHNSTPSHTRDKTDWYQQPDVHN